MRALLRAALRHGSCHSVAVIARLLGEHLPDLSSHKRNAGTARLGRLLDKGIRIRYETRSGRKFENWRKLTHKELNFHFTNRHHGFEIYPTVLNKIKQTLYLEQTRNMQDRRVSAH
jgi:hypothetical protein